MLMRRAELLMMLARVDESAQIAREAADRLRELNLEWAAEMGSRPRRADRRTP